MASPNGTQPSPAEPDWTDQVTDLVVDVVDSVREKTTGPVLKGARGIVFGTVAIIVLLPVNILAVILLGRVISMLPIEEWISYLVLGSLMTAIGFVLWGKRLAS